MLIILCSDRSCFALIHKSSQNYVTDYCLVTVVTFRKTQKKFLHLV